MGKPAGWALFALIVLLTIVLLALFGISGLISQGVRASVMGINDAKAIYLANAGIMDAIASYRSATTNGSVFELGCFGSGSGCDNNPNLNLGAEDVFIRPTASSSLFHKRDFLAVDMSDQNANPVLTSRTGNRSTFDNWELKDVASLSLSLPTVLPMTIVGLEVRWTSGKLNVAEKVEWVCFSTNATVSKNNQNPNQSCYDNPPAGYGELISLPTYPRNEQWTPQNDNWFSNNHIWFNRDISTTTPMTIAITFLLDDSAGCNPQDPVVPLVTDLNLLRRHQLTENCKRTGIWVNGTDAENWALWTVRSIGESRSTPFTLRRTLRAEFRARATVSSQREQIISWTEE